MKKIPDGTVDMVLCDLPYGTTCNKWDVCLPFDCLWDQWHRVCKQNAAVLLFGQMPFTADLVNSNRKEFRYEWIYEKTNASGFLNAKKMPLKAHETISVFYRKLPVYNPQFDMGKPYRRTRSNNEQGRISSNYQAKLQRNNTLNCTGDRYPRDVLKVSNVNWKHDKGKGHPTQKPTSLLEYLIRTYSNPGETVLDNCMGSGTTGVACVNTGRDFIGIELDKGYFEIAKKRIENAQAQIKTE